MVAYQQVLGERVQAPPEGKVLFLAQLAILLIAIPTESGQQVLSQCLEQFLQAMGQLPGFPWKGNGEINVGQ